MKNSELLAMCEVKEVLYNKKPKSLKKQLQLAMTETVRHWLIPRGYGLNVALAAVITYNKEMKNEKNIKILNENIEKMRALMNVSINITDVPMPEKEIEIISMWTKAMKGKKA